ncbi:MAG: alpha/beta fold hydrolase [Leptospiraceae bacterium]|nr:alpha/beta fold hydrolase [Leptospiraceae bacterium]
MKLFFRKLIENGKPILILHGLFGSSKNWLGNGKELSEFGTVYLLDARNHGDSPHAETHSLKDMVSDLKEFISENNLSGCTILGHSMGGLVAIQFALQYPELCDRLIVIDIAPKNYELNYETEFRAMSIDVSNKKNRDEIDQEMLPIIHDTFIRQFLQMNLERTDNGFRWKINLDAIQKRKDALEFDINDKTFTKKSLFVLGGDSEYVKQSDHVLIKNYFPSSRIDVIPHAGHYLHYLNKEEFLKIVKNFLSEV